jgi:hypothetical protein
MPTMNPDFGCGLDRWFLAKYTNTPIETLAELVRLADDSQLETLAELDRLANDPHCVIRSIVARNPYTLPETLARLADDVSDNVRYWVTENPNTPQYVKEYLNAVEFMRIYEDLLWILKV